MSLEPWTLRKGRFFPYLHDRRRVVPIGLAGLSVGQGSAGRVAVGGVPGRGRALAVGEQAVRAAHTARRRRVEGGRRPEHHGLAAK